VVRSVSPIGGSFDAGKVGCNGHRQQRPDDWRGAPALQNIGDPKRLVLLPAKGR